MNSRERQVAWLEKLDQHAGHCDTCWQDADECPQWIELIHSYNVAAPIDFDDIPNHIAITER